jgi:DNA-directed RNA polymerase subunit RPC12/RpoP
VKQKYVCPDCGWILKTKANRTRCGGCGSLNLERVLPDGRLIKADADENAAENAHLIRTRSSDLNAHSSEMTLEAISDAKLILDPNLMEKTRRTKLVKIVKQKGREWAIAALVDGSIGYHTVTGAANVIDQLLQGGRLWACERTLACFHGDALAELEADFAYFQRKETYAIDEIRALVQYVRRKEPELAKFDSTQRWAAETTDSMLYPTRQSTLNRP